MQMQNTITDFQKQFNGPFPFTSNGVIVAQPSVSFEEEMQTMIAFQGGSISTGTFVHENMHQWWGDNVSEGAFNMTALKEGFASFGEYLWAARTAGLAAGVEGSPAYTTAFNASLTSRFNTNYNTTSSSFWTTAPLKVTAATLFSGSATYTRSSTGYLAMRAILGPALMTKAMTAIQHDFAGGNILVSDIVSEFQRFLPNQSATCRARVDTWATQWFNTSYPTGGANTVNRPQMTGPGQATHPSGVTFYDPTSATDCSVIVPTTTPSYAVAPAGNKTVTLGATDVGGPGVASTTYAVDGGPMQPYTGPFTVTAGVPHTLSYSSTDTAGNIELAKTTTLTTGNPPVSTATTNPVLVGGGAAVPITVTLAATDDNSGVASTEYQLDGGAWTPYTAPFTVSAPGGHTVLYRSTDGDANVESAKTLSLTVFPTTTATVGGTVASTLGITVGTGAPSFGSFVPALAQDYVTSASATITSTAGSSVLTAQDPSATAPGRLVNGAYSLSQPLQLNATDTAQPSSPFAPLAGNDPLALMTFGAPVSGDPVTIGIKQPISATEPLRTGTYSKTVVFTLSTATP
jgi:hypothetical protein